MSSVSFVFLCVFDHNPLSNGLLHSTVFRLMLNIASKPEHDQNVKWVYFLMVSEVFLPIIRGVSLFSPLVQV